MDGLPRVGAGANKHSKLSVRREHTAHKPERLPAPCRSAWFRSGYCRCASSPYACDPRPSEPTHEAGHTPRASMHPATNVRTHTHLVLKSLIAYSRPCVLRQSTSAAHVSGDSTATPSSRCTKPNKRCRLPRRMHAQYIGCIIALVPAAHALRRLRTRALASRRGSQRRRRRRHRPQQ